MGAYSLEVLIRKWGRGELSVEQAIGQILLQVQDLQSTVASLERRVYHWSREDEESNQEDRS